MAASRQGITPGGVPISSPPNDAALIITNSDFPGQDRVYSGKFSVDFSVNDVAATAALSQSFATVFGASYTVTFDFGTYAWSDRSPSLRFDVLGSNGTTQLVSQTLTRPGINPVNSPPVTLAQWTVQTYTFQADGSAATLRFTDTTTPSFASDALLDGVSVSGLSVPEPSSFVMSLLTGLSGIVIASALRRKLGARTAGPPNQPRGPTKTPGPDPTLVTLNGPFQNVL
jgi:hypothetical protein